MKKTFSIVGMALSMVVFVCSCAVYTLGLGNISAGEPVPQVLALAMFIVGALAFCHFAMHYPDSAERRSNQASQPDGEVTKNH